MLFKEGRKKTGGRRRGSKDTKVLDREKALTEHQTAIQLVIEKIRESQLQLAFGTTVMFAREWRTDKGKTTRSGKFVKIIDDEEISVLLNEEDEEKNSYYYITKVEPNEKAIEDLYNRFLGKPKETIEVNDRDRDLLLILQKQNLRIIAMAEVIERDRLKKAGWIFTPRKVEEIEKELQAPGTKE